MKKYLFLFVGAILVMDVRAANGNEFSYEGLNYRIISEDDHTVEVSNSNASGDIVIPSFVTIDNFRYVVAAIRQEAFSGCLSLTSVTIPNSVTQIGDRAFFYCGNLTSVTIPNSVTEIGLGALSSCSRLTEIIIEDGNKSYSSENGVLYNSDKTILIQAPGAIKEMEIPNSVTQIEDSAFFRCRSLTSVIIPNSVTKIGSEAFSYCSNLTLVTIPNSVTQIGSGVFFCCRSLTSVIIPNSVTQIGDTTFSYCSNLTSVTIPNSVTQIENGAFFECSNLTSITIPNSVTQIGDEAFSFCRSLTSVSIPNSVTQIGLGAFKGCISLTGIILEDANKNYCSENGVLYNSDRTILIQAPGAIKEMDIPSFVTQIGNGAFSYCSDLTSVTISSSVNQIESGAFFECSNLTSVTIPNSVTQIGNMAFSDCRSLTSVTIPNSVIQIGRWAFDGCRSLTSVTIPNSVTQIEYGTFSGCSSLTSVIIPNSVTKIGGQAFSDCRSLRKIIDLNPKPLALGNFEFYNVPADAVIYIPKGSLEAYRKAYGWTQFTDFCEMGAFNLSLSVTELNFKKGEITEITVNIEKDSEVTIESEKWYTSNPEVAIVENGKVTAVGEGTAVIYFTVIDSYGAPHTESCKVTVTDETGVREVTIDASVPVDVYTMQGIAVLHNVLTADLGNLPAGIYIIRQGKAAKKVVVK